MRKPTYKYGVELECYIPKNNFTPFSEKVRNEIEYIVGGDPSIRVPDYANWRSMEIKGNKGLTYDKTVSSIEKLTKWMADYKVDVNRSCGFHLHMSNNGFLDNKNLKRIVKLWLACEDVFFATQPMPRQKNTYCMSRLKEQVRDHQSSWYSPQEKNNILDQLRGNTRYYALNLHSLYKRKANKTIEIRLHAGTTKNEDVKNWIDLMTGFFNYALSKEYSPQLVTALCNKKLSMRKAYLVLKLLGITEEQRKFYARRITKSTFRTYNLAREQAQEVMKIKKEEVTWKKAQEKAHKELRELEETIKKKTEILKVEQQKITNKLAELSKLRQDKVEKLYETI